LRLCLTGFLLALAVHATALAEYQAKLTALQEAQANHLDCQVANNNLLKTSSDANEIRRSREVFWAALQRFNQASAEFSELAEPPEIQEQKAEIAANAKANNERQFEEMRRSNEERWAEIRAREEKDHKESIERQAQEKIANDKAQLENDAAMDARYVKMDNNETGVITRLGLKVQSENGSWDRPPPKSKGTSMVGSL
jgi:hypothetical protein